MTKQPTHHGWAVNVKDHGSFGIDTGNLPDDLVQALYDSRGEDFWSLAQDVAQAHGFEHVYSEGRMGGWAQVWPQPSDELEETELADWERMRFRPFETELLALLDACREAFIADIAQAREEAAREPVERAYWEACDVITR